MKSRFLLITLFAYLCLPGLAGANWQATPAHSTKKEKAAGEETQPQSKSGEPAADHSGLTRQRKPEVVPPAGPAAGITPESAQPQAPGAVSPRPAAAPAVSAKDQELGQRIEKALTNEPSLSNARVQVEVVESKITLTGTVADGLQRRAATRIVRSFAGDRQVVDQLTVVGAKVQGEESPPAGPRR
jgi:hypothetical protein